MITIILLTLIYLAFISLGLPDSILGVSLPAILQEWGIPLSAGGIISMTIVGSTIVSSFTSSYIIRKIGTGKIVFISCLLTGAALLGFSVSPSFFWLIMLAIPLGLGGGSVDAALNNYVALHYKAHHMNWLHSFWGVGATLGPIIMSFALDNSGWRSGYRIISVIQLSLSVVLFFSLSLWRKVTPIEAKSENINETARLEVLKIPVFRIPGVKVALTTVMFYCAVEISIGLWGSTYLIHAKGFSIENAASWMALYYGGITAGRFIAGFISFKLTNTQMIRTGMILALAGITVLILPLGNIVTGLAIVLTGLGLAPIYPSMLHETPKRFGKRMSQAMIGYQIGFAGIGAALLSPLIGLVLQHTSVFLFPVYITGIVVIMFITSEILSRSRFDVNQSSRQN